MNDIEENAFLIRGAMIEDEDQSDKLQAVVAQITDICPWEFILIVQEVKLH
jgi:hypothetical protein